MKKTKLFFILLSIYFTNSFLLFSQLSTQELLIKREIESLRKQQKIVDLPTDKHQPILSEQFDDTLRTYIEKEDSLDKKEASKKEASKKEASKKEANKK